MSERIVIMGARGQVGVALCRQLQRAGRGYVAVGPRELDLTDAKIERKLRPVMAITTSFGAFILITLFSFNAVSDLILILFRGPETIATATQENSILLIGSIVALAILAFPLSMVRLIPWGMTVKPMKPCRVWM